VAFLLLEGVCFYIECLFPIFDGDEAHLWLSMMFSVRYGVRGLARGSGETRVQMQDFRRVDAGNLGEAAKYSSGIKCWS